jgi:hypothetical protein
MVEGSGKEKKRVHKEKGKGGNRMEEEERGKKRRGKK